MPSLIDQFVPPVGTPSRILLEVVNVSLIEQERNLDYLEYLSNQIEVLPIQPTWFDSQSAENKLKFLQIYQIAVNYARNLDNFYRSKHEQLSLAVEHKVKESHRKKEEIRAEKNTIEKMKIKYKQVKLAIARMEKKNVERQLQMQYEVEQHEFYRRQAEFNAMHFQPFSQQVSPQFAPTIQGHSELHSGMTTPEKFNKLKQRPLQRDKILIKEEKQSVSEKKNSIRKPPTIPSNQYLDSQENSNAISLRKTKQKQPEASSVKKPFEFSRDAKSRHRVNSDEELNPSSRVSIGNKVFDEIKEDEVPMQTNNNSNRHMLTTKIIRSGIQINIPDEQSSVDLEKLLLPSPRQASKVIIASRQSDDEEYEQEFEDQIVSLPQNPIAKQSSDPFSNQSIGSEIWQTECESINDIKLKVQSKKQISPRKAGNQNSQRASIVLPEQTKQNDLLNSNHGYADSKVGVKIGMVRGNKNNSTPAIPQSNQPPQESKKQQNQSSISAFDLMNSNQGQAEQSGIKLGLNRGNKKIPTSSEAVDLKKQIYSSHLTGDAQGVKVFNETPTRAGVQDSIKQQTTPGDVRGSVYGREMNGGSQQPPLGVKVFNDKPKRASSTVVTEVQNDQFGDIASMCEVSKRPNAKKQSKVPANDKLLAPPKMPSLFVNDAKKSIVQSITIKIPDLAAKTLEASVEAPEDDEYDNDDFQGMDGEQLLKSKLSFNQKPNQSKIPIKSKFADLAGQAFEKRQTILKTTQAVLPAQSLEKSNDDDIFGDMLQMPMNSRIAQRPSSKIVQLNKKASKIYKNAFQSIQEVEQQSNSSEIKKNKDSLIKVDNNLKSLDKNDATKIDQDALISLANLESVKFPKANKKKNQTDSGQAAVDLSTKRQRKESANSSELNEEIKQILESGINAGTGRRHQYELKMFNLIKKHHSNEHQKEDPKNFDNSLLEAHIKKKMNKNYEESQLKVADWKKLQQICDEDYARLEKQQKKTDISKLVSLSPDPNELADSKPLLKQNSELKDDLSYSQSIIRPLQPHPVQKKQDHQSKVFQLADLTVSQSFDQTTEFTSIGRKQQSRNPVAPSTSPKQANGRYLRSMKPSTEQKKIMSRIAGGHKYDVEDPIHQEVTKNQKELRQLKVDDIEDDFD